MVSEVTHVALAFMRADVFNQDAPSEWPLFTTVEHVRTQFASKTEVLVAIGGWGDTESFSRAASTSERRQRFGRNIKAMLDATGADGKSAVQSYSCTLTYSKVLT